ncbi:MAG TPA: pyruvate dehydrogenase (acetyl-transferring), homodimeric type, partial [Pirellulaceae bacterium]|nr:pyruvate dehydrogenase (acetyl-transferring), homodimeric type [Pirellulaceae bacterium]
MTDVIKPASNIEQDSPLTPAADIDPTETQEWVDSLQYVLNSRGAERVKYLLSVLEARAKTEGVDLPIKSNTPYINTFSRAQQPVYPGNRDIERRIKSTIRWNAMAMVARANQDFEGIGGHISTFGSS